MARSASECQMPSGMGDGPPGWKSADRKRRNKPRASTWSIPLFLSRRSPPTPASVIASVCTGPFPERLASHLRPSAEMPAPRDITSFIDSYEGEAESLLLEHQHMKADILYFGVGKYLSPTRRGQSLFLPALRGRFQRHVEQLTRMPAG